MLNYKITHDFTKTALSLACISPEIPKKVNNRWLYGCTFFQVCTHNTRYVTPET